MPLDNLPSGKSLHLRIPGFFVSCKREYFLPPNPSHAQTIRMKELSREGKLDTDTINDIMREQKGNQKDRLKIPVERLRKYFPSDASPNQMEETIIKALEFYRKRQREDRDER